MNAQIYHFDWDANKARTNLRKHGVTFRLASTVFRDGLSITIFDDEHSNDEDRWITIGRADNGQLLVVVHTYLDVANSIANVAIRIISARRADVSEQLDYQSCIH